MVSNVVCVTNHVQFNALHSYNDIEPIPRSKVLMSHRLQLRNPLSSNILLYLRDSYMYNVLRGTSSCQPQIQFNLSTSYW